MDLKNEYQVLRAKYEILIQEKRELLEHIQQLATLNVKYEGHKICAEQLESENQRLSQIMIQQQEAQHTNLLSQQEEVLLLKEQVRISQEDFNTERAEREKIHSEKLALQEQLEKANITVEALQNQMRAREACGTSTDTSTDTDRTIDSRRVEPVSSGESGNHIVLPAKQLLRMAIQMRKLGKKNVACYLSMAKLGVSLEHQEMMAPEEYMCSKECRLSVDRNGGDLTVSVFVSGKLVDTFHIPLADIFKSRCPWNSPMATKIKMAAENARRIDIEVELFQDGESIRKLALPELLPTEETADFSGMD